MRKVIPTSLILLVAVAASAQSLDHDPDRCLAPATFIHEVQGHLPHSLLLSQVVTLEGVVVGDYQDDSDEFGTDLGGFMIQEEDADTDSDPATSEGIFVYAPDRPEDVNVGDLVRVTGTVAEYHDLTELVDVTQLLMCASGVPLPTPAIIEFPLESVDVLEAFEGMLVTFPQELVISEFFNYDRYGEVVLTWQPEGLERWYQPTELFRFGADGLAEYRDLLARSRITLDDGISSQNPGVIRHPDGGMFMALHGFRGGDRLGNLTGVLDYAFGVYRVQPVLGAQFTAANPRPQQPADVGGTVRAASFNVLNYFSSLGSRGADDAAEFGRQRSKILAALAAMDAHAVGLVEIQNDASQESLQDLVMGLNELTGPGRYDFVRTGAPLGTDQITVAVIYQPGALTPVGAPAVLDSSAFTDPLGSGHARNRPALAQTFTETATGGSFTLVVNHFKSKGSECGEPTNGGVTGNCHFTRVQAARQLHEWLAGDPTRSGHGNHLLVGDYNSYSLEGPVFVLRAGPDGLRDTGDDFTDLIREFSGEGEYTYLFDGQLGYLDHALASPSLLPSVTGVTVWHINADEPDILDYDLSFKSAAQAALFRPDPFRSSDHDPVIIGLQLRR